ncbi:MAG: hypothetical protein R3Y63_10445 [Eubacteriales bacterium]
MFSLGQKRLAQFISRIMTRQHMRNPLVWVTHPSQEELTNYLSYRALVYDCPRLWEGDYINQQEALFQNADLIFYPSPSLQEPLKLFHRNLSMLENGVNYSIFEKAALFARQDPFTKTLGFAGQIDYYLDLSPLLFMAREQPLWQFLLLGTCPQGNPYLETLLSLNNVKFYQGCTPQLMAEFLFSCDVLLEFHLRKHPVQDIKSLRLYQYLATGRPIVSHILDKEEGQLSDLIYYAETKEEFLYLSKKALKEQSHAVEIKRQQYAKNNRWELRGQQVKKLLVTSGLL